MIWNVFLVDVGNRITELSKVISQLHSEMKQIHTDMFDYSDSSKADPSGGSSFLGKYIIGAKNNFKDFNNDERKTAPMHEEHYAPLHHEEQAETVEEKREETGDVQESPTTDGKSNEEQSSETGIDEVIEISMEEEGAEKNTDTENTSETVIDVESHSDVESEAGGKREDEAMTEKAKDNVEELNADEATGGSDLKEAETEENGEVEENNETTEDINVDVVEVVNEGIKFDMSQTSLVSLLAKRIEEKLEKNFTFSGNKASSPTGSDDSQDTGFGSQEFEPSTSSP